MNAVIFRPHKIWYRCDPALCRGIEFHHPASDARRIELFIPRGVERIGEVDALAVATDFNHLGAAAQRLVGPGGMWCLTHHSTDMHRAVFLGWKGSETSYCSISPVPHRRRKKPIVQGKSISVTKGGTALNPSTRRELLGIGWLSGISITSRFATLRLAYARPNPGAQILERDDHTRKSICLGGSCAGRNSRTIWYSLPSSSA